MVLRNNLIGLCPSYSLDAIFKNKGELVMLKLKLKHIKEETEIPNQKYVEVDTQEVENPKKCAVCGRDITTVVVLKGKNGKRYTVGSVCASHILDDD